MIDSLQLVEPQAPEPSLAWFNGALLFEPIVENTECSRKDTVRLRLSPDFIVGKILRQTIGSYFYDDIIFLLNRIHSLPSEHEPAPPFPSFREIPFSKSDLSNTYDFSVPFPAPWDEPVQFAYLNHNALCPDVAISPTPDQRACKICHGLKKVSETDSGSWHKPMHWDESGQVFGGSSIPTPSYPSGVLSKWDEQNGTWVEYYARELKDWIVSQERHNADQNYFRPERLQGSNKLSIWQIAPEGTEHLVHKHREYSSERTCSIEDRVSASEWTSTNRQHVEYELRFDPQSKKLKRVPVNSFDIQVEVSHGKQNVETTDTAKLRAEYAADLKTQAEHMTLLRSAQPKKRKMPFGLTRITKKGKVVGVKTLTIARAGELLWFMTANKLLRATSEDIKAWTEKLALPEELKIGGRDIFVSDEPPNTHDTKEWLGRVGCKFSGMQDPTSHPDWNLEVLKARQIVGNESLTDLVPEGISYDTFKTQMQELDSDYGIEPLNSAKNRFWNAIHADVVEAISPLEGEQIFPAVRRVLAKHRKRYVAEAVRRVRRDLKGKGVSASTVKRRVKAAQEKAVKEFDLIDELTLSPKVVLT